MKVDIQPNVEAENSAQQSTRHYAGWHRTVARHYGKRCHAARSVDTMACNEYVTCEVPHTITTRRAARAVRYIQTPRHTPAGALSTGT